LRKSSWNERELKRRWVSRCDQIALLDFSLFLGLEGGRGRE
jgi:hypothetical protein